MNNIRIGPYLRERVVLCAGDASPDSQRGEPCEAKNFFPGGKWVGTMRNAADRLNCKFIIFTGKYGVVGRCEIIGPFDVPGHTEEEIEEIRERCIQTIPRLIGNNRYDVVVFYAGGNPRDMIIEILKPILSRNNLDLITFGKPNMYDAGKIDNFVEHLIRGTSLDELRTILKVPEKLKFFPR